MIFTIPKSLQLGGVTITVEQKDAVIDRLENVFGLASFEIQLIELSNQCKKDYKEMTFFHELVHMILHHMGESDMCGNEKFVDGFSTLLYQAIKTMK